MKSLTNDQREEVKEIFDWGHFMDSAMKYHQDAGSNDISDNNILLLIKTKKILDMFSDYHYKNDPCELCGSHGSVYVKIGEKLFVLKEW